MTALLPDLTPAEAVLWDAMLSAGWTSAQCRMAFAAAKRGIVVAAQSGVTRLDIDRYRDRPDQMEVMLDRQRDLVLRRLGAEAAKLASVTHAYDRTTGEDVLQARLFVVRDESLALRSGRS